MQSISIDQDPAAFYLLASDEPLLLRDWLDQARLSFRQAGIDEVQVEVAEAGYHWEALLEESNAMSLFADKKCRIININNGKPGQKGSRVIQALCEQQPEDVIFIFVVPGLSRQVRNTSWLKALQQAGKIVELKSIGANQLAGWIIQRAREKQLSIDQQSAAYLAERTEGNLLAADQELEKLSIQYADQGKVSFEAIEQSVAQSARYSQFELVDACLAGNSKRALKILGSLQGEGYVTPQLRWPLQSSLEQLARLKQAQSKGRLGNGLWQELRIWSSKQRLFETALKRLGLDQIERLIQSCATLDRISKGQQDDDFPGRDWLQVKALVCSFSGLAHILQQD
jgi:DNA polymerase-3 subunit delta